MKNGDDKRQKWPASSFGSVGLFFLPRSSSLAQTRVAFLAFITLMLISCLTLFEKFPNQHPCSFPPSLPANPNSIPDTHTFEGVCTLKVPQLSSVMSVCFARFHPNLVVGGTYSGQIVLWDNRSHRRTPVQRTPLSAAAHTHPVYCVNVVGTQNAHNLITVSTDGKMCSWSLDMLSTPQESMELVYNKSKPVAVTGMAFPTGDVNNFVVGSEEGTVYTACRHGSKAGIGEVFEGHQGPVTGINCHMAVGPIDFSHLFVTSSFDWTVKLWTTKVIETVKDVVVVEEPLKEKRRKSKSHNKPLYSFEDNADYVYDVMWSPVHPALFACVDGMGRLDLWNLNNDTEVPTASVAIEGASALNRVRWAQAGKEVAVGDSEGRIWVYDVGELAVPHNDEWTRFARTLVEIRANRADSEEEGTVELSA
ncbi:Cytoplasmic dynein 1 intermediate chain 1 [Pteropus alecto]|uniref:Cytoplasmic dynein 1 intermediate chain 1 n=1 Tax=Pteropus alecto TaxID=9402 RepID=L5KLW3_PTEAL|nr:Cytoplasmic dynein 1 intermediate chain 1 [Pteropus alecto]